MAKLKWDPAPPGVGWNRVKSLREMRHLTQLQLCVGAGISTATLWWIEAGFDERTRVEIKRKLAAFFECDLSDIFPAQMIGNETKEDFIRRAKEVLKPK